MRDLKKKVSNKADQEALDQLAENQKSYSTLRDLKDLYNKVVPQLSEFEKTMCEFEKNHLQFKEMITRYDEVIAQKANKTALIGVEVKCRESFVKKDDHEEQATKMNEQLNEHGVQIDKLNQTMQILNENLTKDIHTAVRKVAKQMESNS